MMARLMILVGVVLVAVETARAEPYGQPLPTYAAPCQWQDRQSIDSNYHVHSQSYPPGYPVVVDPPPTPPCVTCDEPTLVRGGLLESGLYGGFEFLWMRATFDQNVALIIDPPVGNTLVPFAYSMNLMPRTWLGVQSRDGLGWRATYFRFDDSAGPVSATAVAGATPVYVNVFGAGGNLSRNATANVGQTLVSDHSLKLQTLDFEATQVLAFRNTRALIGLGVRIADMDQNLLGNVFNPGGTLEESVSNDLRFTGAGPTASAHLTRSMGQSGWNVYATGRTSLLMTKTEQRIYEMKGAFTTELEDIAEQREVLGNFEIGVGIQFGQSIGRSAGLFARVGYETQLWIDAGGPVNSHSTVGLDSVSLALGLNL